jgi:hypothetical protein
VAALHLAGPAGWTRTSVNAAVALLGSASVLLILYRIIDPPNFGGLGTTFGFGFRRHGSAADRSRSARSGRDCLWRLLVDA